MDGTAVPELEQQTVQDEMGTLHNRMVAYISESRLPLANVVLVLQLLLDEAIELAKKEYLGE